MNIADAQAWLTSRVSRETMVRLDLFHNMLERWQNTVNLVAPSTIKTSWSRHFVDSAQLYDLPPKGVSAWLDLGSGAGFPGLVIAAMAVDDRPDLRITLIESDTRKCGFMREAARAMGVKVNILSCRIADAEPQEADVITARALGNLSLLIELAEPHARTDACLLFPKGGSYQKELDAIPMDWQALVKVHDSVTDVDAKILCLTVPTRSEEG